MQKTVQRGNNTFEKGNTNMLVYQNEIKLPVFTPSTHVAPVAEKENEGRLHFNGKCMCVQLKVHYRYMHTLIGKDYDELQGRQQRDKTAY